MNILFVDDENKISVSESYNTYLATSKNEALQKIKDIHFSAIFINSKFNNNFLEQIREITQIPALYLVDSSSSYQGMVEYANLIDGYFQAPCNDRIERTLEKLKVRV